MNMINSNIWVGYLVRIYKQYTFITRSIALLSNRYEIFLTDAAYCTKFHNSNIKISL